VKPIASGKDTHGVIVSDDGLWGFVSKILASSVSVINMRIFAVVTAFAVGRGPNGIMFKNANCSPRTR